jgi:hypothetical protein
MPATDAAQHEHTPIPRSSARRLLALMRPYLGLVLLAALLSASYSGGR